MAKKSFEIQGSTLRIGGLDLQAGTTSVVIPGVTQATTYTVEEVKDNDGAQEITFETAPVVIDIITFNDLVDNGSTAMRAEYQAELDDDGYIDDIEVNAGGTYSVQDYNVIMGATSLLAYTGVEASPFAPFVPEAWATLPFRVKMKAGEVENIGGGDANTGDIRFDNDTIHHEQNQEVGITLNPSTPIAKMYVETTRNWGFDAPYDWSTPANWIDENGQGRVSFTGISQSLFNLMDNDIGRYIRRTISINNGEPVNIVNWGYNGPVNGTVDFYTETGPGGDPVAVTTFTVSAVFENRIVLDDDAGDFGFYLDNNNFAVQTQSDINLTAGDDVRIRGKDAFQLTNESNDGSGIEITTRYGMPGQSNWEFTDRGALNLPNTGNRSFYAVFDEAHYGGSLPLTGEPWGFNIEFQVQADGTITTVIQNNIPFTANPGYTTGMVFYFYDQDHNVPGYGITITITDIQNPGEFMYTANLAASEPPTYPNTLYSNGLIKITSSENSWMLGADGSTTLPSGQPLLFGNGNSRIQAGMGFHVSSEEGISLEAVDTTDAENPITKGWYFSPNGSLTFPSGAAIETEYGGSSRLVIDGTDQFVDIRSAATILIGFNNSSGNVFIGDTGGGQVDIVGPKFRVLAEVPTTSTGKAGDQPGQVAFDGTYIYYCTGTYPTTYDVILYGGYSGNRFPGIAKGDYPQPQAGWTFVWNLVTYTVIAATDPNAGQWQLEVDQTIDTQSGGTITFITGSPGNIWKRVAWSADTW